MDTVCAKIDTIIINAWVQLNRHKMNTTHKETQNGQNRHNIRKQKQYAQIDMIGTKDTLRHKMLRIQDTNGHNRQKWVQDRHKRHQQAQNPHKRQTRTQNSQNGHKYAEMDRKGTISPKMYTEQKQTSLALIGQRRTQRHIINTKGSKQNKQNGQK